MSFIYGHNENAMPRYAHFHQIRTRVPFPRASFPDETTRFVRTPRWRNLVLNERPVGGRARPRARAVRRRRVARRERPRELVRRARPRSPASRAGSRRGPHRFERAKSVFGRTTARARTADRTKTTRSTNVSARVSDRKSLFLPRESTETRLPSTQWKEPVLQCVRQRFGPELRQRDHGPPHHAFARTARRPLLHLLRRRRRSRRPASVPRDAAECLQRRALECALAGVRRPFGRARAVLRRLRRRRGAELRRRDHRPPLRAVARSAGRALADRLRRRRQRADGEACPTGHRRVRGEGARAAGQRHLRRRAAAAGCRG